MWDEPPTAELHFFHTWIGVSRYSVVNFFWNTLDATCSHDTACEYDVGRQDSVVYNFVTQARETWDRSLHSQRTKYWEEREMTIIRERKSTTGVQPLKLQRSTGERNERVLFRERNTRAREREHNRRSKITTGERNKRDFFPREKHYTMLLRERERARTRALNWRSISFVKRLRRFKEHFFSCFGTWMYVCTLMHVCSPRLIGGPWVL